jgi:hypothetical protein
MKLDIIEAPITIQSSAVDLGEVLPDYARHSILRVAGKYFGRLTRASVHFNREGGRLPLHGHHADGRHQACDRRGAR